MVTFPGKRITPTRVWSATGNSVSLCSSFTFVQPASPVETQFRNVHTFCKLARVTLWSCMCLYQIQIYSSLSTFTSSLLVTHTQHTHSLQGFSPLLALHPLFCLLQNKCINSDEPKAIMSDLPFHWRAPGWCQVSLRAPSPLVYMSPHELFKLIWRAGCCLLVCCKSIFQRCALYLYCLREQVGLCKKPDSRRTMNCYS